MKLRFDSQKIGKWAHQYGENVSQEEEALMELRSPRLGEEGMDWLHLQKLIRWKSPRNAYKVQQKDDLYIREVTRVALSTTSERARIEVLTLLDGVAWPTASVILHFYHAAPYPILDVRALWSVTADASHKYDFGFWREYVQFCREEAERANVDMRTLDRALWQFSKVTQPQGKT